MTMNAIIAVNPQQMQEAQATTTGWISKKLADAQQDLADAEATLFALKAGGFARTDGAKSLVRKANLRIQFYTKVKAALDAGYYIIPPFDLQLFVVRTDQNSPNETGRRNWANDQKGRTLPAGKGDYVNPVVGRTKIGTQTVKSGDTTSEVAIYQNSNWQDSIDIPIRALKPQIIQEVGRALELKIFDALGIAPAYRAADPIIAGHIRRPAGGALTFFVAWWLDEQDL